MNLCVDQGNSRIKIAVFDGNRLVDTYLFKRFESSLADEIFRAYPIEHAIFCSVSVENTAVRSWLAAHLENYMELSYQTPIPLINTYSTPQTLGNDRLAAAVGAYSLGAGNPLLVIDAGSAITYDLVSADGQYIGGNIAPGMKMRFSALHDYTSSLPYVEPSENDTYELTGKDTRKAILNGVMNGILYEMEGYIRHYREIYPNLSVFLTGGNFSYFHNRLKITTFAERNLVLIGLNRILEYNV